MQVAQNTAHTAHAQGRMGDPFGWRCVGVGCVKVTAARSAVKWTCIDFMLLQASPTDQSHAIAAMAGRGRVQLQWRQEFDETFDDCAGQSYPIPVARMLAPPAEEVY